MQSFAHQHCWDKSPCLGRNAPASPVDPQPHPPLPAPLRPPPPSGRRNGDDADHAGRARDTARKRSEYPSFATGEEGARSPLHLRPRPNWHRQAGAPTSSSDPLLPYLSTATSKASRRRRERQRAAQCHRTLQWRRADSQRSLKQRERREKGFDLLQPWEVTKIIRNVMILVQFHWTLSVPYQIH